MIVSVDFYYFSFFFLLKLGVILAYVSLLKLASGSIPASLSSFSKYSYILSFKAEKSLTLSSSYSGNRISLADCYNAALKGLTLPSFALIYLFGIMSFSSINLLVCFVPYFLSLSSIVRGFVMSNFA